jgi:hypothetical protein
MVRLDDVRKWKRDPHAFPQRAGVPAGEVTGRQVPLAVGQRALDRRRRTDDGRYVSCMTKKRGARPPTASVSPIEAAFRSSEAAREYMSKRGRQASDVAGFVRSLKIASELVTAETRRAEQRTAFHETMAGIERLRASGVAVVAMIGEAAAMPFVGMAVELIDGIVPR